MAFCTPSGVVRSIAGLAAALAAVCAPAAGQQPGEAGARIGRIEGAGVLVRSAAGGLQAAATATPVASGDAVELAGDYARLALDDGGEVSVCGPARFTLLRSGRMLTIALDYGRVRPRLAGELEVMVYSPFVVARPIAIAEGTRDAVVGLELDGAMCVLAERGAMRLENQFSGETLVIPQSGAFVLRDGELAPMTRAAASCRCDPPVARPPMLLAELRPAAPASASEPAAEAPRRPASVSSLRPAEGVPAPAGESPPPPALATPPAAEPAEWRVEMPPLLFEAARPEYVPRAEPEYALLIREVRVTPALVFRGRVESGRGAAVARRPETQAVRLEVAEPRESVGGFRKLGRFFKRIFGG